MNKAIDMFVFGYQICFENQILLYCISKSIQLNCTLIDKQSIADKSYGWCYCDRSKNRIQHNCYSLKFMFAYEYELTVL